jgi:hypothetical protein
MSSLKADARFYFSERCYAVHAVISVPASLLARYST